MAALFLRGITAFMLLERVRPVHPGEVLLVHAAAGGLGLILTQWAKRRGALVIGTVGGATKAETARAHGLDHAILYREQDFVSEVRHLTDGRGVDYAIDGIGGETLTKTLDAVRPFGVVASIGQAGGPVRPIDIAELGPGRSLALARPSVLRLTGNSGAYLEAARAVLGDGGRRASRRRGRRHLAPRRRSRGPSGTPRRAGPRAPCCSSPAELRLGAGWGQRPLERLGMAAG